MKKEVYYRLLQLSPILFLFSLTGFFILSDKLKWFLLFLLFFSFNFSYKLLQRKVRKRWLSEKLFFTVEILLLLIILFLARRIQLFEKMFTGNLLYGTIFCTLAVLMVTAGRKLFFQKIKQKHYLAQNISKKAMLFELLAVTSEEIWFRGAILYLLLNNFTLSFAVLISSALFSLAHVHKGRIIILWCFINGIIFSFSVAIFGNILSSIWGHFLLNILNKYHWSFKKF
jgi:membrane protease YdiL (CAAX protease family)